MSDTRTPPLTLDLSPSARWARVELYAREGRLIQGDWHKRGGGGGRELACLLGALDPAIDDTGRCPGEVAPEWLAHLIVPMFDGVRPAARAVELGGEFAAVMQRAVALPSDAWDRIEVAVKIYSVRQALEAARPKGDAPEYWPAVERACLDVIDALSRGDKRARGTAGAAVDAAADDAYAKANAAAYAITAFAIAAAAEAANANAADAAARAADAAAEAAGWAAVEGAAAAWEPLFAEVISLIRAEIERGEAA